MIITTTERLSLRHFHLSEAEALTQVFGDADVMRFGPGVQTQAWIEAWLHTCLENYQKLGYGPWAVVEKTQATLLGYCGLFYFPDVAGQPEVELGYRFVRRYWGQGYATEATQAVCEYGFRVLGLSRLIALIDPHNLASIRVAEKIGMQYEKAVMLDGYTYPDHVYAMTNPALE